MPHGLTTAPTNLAPQWPSGYIEALREAGAQEKAIPFCIRWVREFFAEHRGRRRRDLGHTEIEVLLKKVVARPDITNWQVQQARESLVFDYERFRGIALAPRPDAVITPPAWNAAEPVRGPTRPGPVGQRPVTVENPAPSTSYHAADYGHARPLVKHHWWRGPVPGPTHLVSHFRGLSKPPPPEMVFSEKSMFTGVL